MRFGIALSLMLLTASPALADFQRITQRDSFLSLIQDRDLTRFGIRLKVTDSGTIQGRAFGRKISGTWDWSGGYFCRDLFVNGDVLDEDNCQTVEVHGDTLRFTSDKGQGDYADLKLR